jgi:hypothetical protein
VLHKSAPQPQQVVPEKYPAYNDSYWKNRFEKDLVSKTQASYMQRTLEYPIWLIMFLWEGMMVQFAETLPPPWLTFPHRTFVQNTESCELPPSSVPISCLELACVLDLRISDNEWARITKTQTVSWHATRLMRERNVVLLLLCTKLLKLAKLAKERVANTKLIEFIAVFADNAEEESVSNVNNIFDPTLLAIIKKLHSRKNRKGVEGPKKLQESNDIKSLTKSQANVALAWLAGQEDNARIQQEKLAKETAFNLINQQKIAKALAKKAEKEKIAKEYEMDMPDSESDSDTEVITTYDLHGNLVKEQRKENGRLVSTTHFNPDTGDAI